MEVQEQNKQKDGAVKKPAVQTQFLTDDREMYFEHLFKVHLLIFYKVPFYISYKKSCDAFSDILPIQKRVPPHREFFIY